ncbi:MAG: MoaD/ThiS family protein [Chloroflexi bacterium]|nr:MoaD/ThiS family protein [Chloroflexota bacterium]MCH8340346.1 MoaD/ThiS family protein [Chloroflexota bacterium]MCH8877503.1 MoaD/ThiS family protein [Chloroflexota bacterium]MCI0772762.1 MoaD/ThiS family protein [Chloroflexota bacterium]MCI0806584.1 MoaD/ThiS family protein [Chloroflexota bacterium]
MQRIEEVETGTVAAAVTELNERYPGIHDRLMEPDGSLRRYVNVFVEGEDGRWPGEANTQIEDGKQVWIVPNIAGGVVGPSPETSKLGQPDPSAQIDDQRPEGWGSQTRVRLLPLLLAAYFPQTQEFL